MSPRAYDPLVPAKSPDRPTHKPVYRLLVNKKFADHWRQLVSRVGMQQAMQFWEHVTSTPGIRSGVANITILKGKAGQPKAEGWSRTHHYEVSSSARIDYLYHNAYKTRAEGDEHKVVAILTIAYGSH